MDTICVILLAISAIGLYPARSETCGDSRQKYIYAHLTRFDDLDRFRCGDDVIDIANIRDRVFRNRMRNRAVFSGDCAFNDLSYSGLGIHAFHQLVKLPLTT